MMDTHESDADPSRQAEAVPEAAQADCRLIIETPSGDQFDATVPRTSLLRQLAADFFEQQGWLRPETWNGGLSVVVELVNPANPGHAWRLDPDLTITEADLKDGDTIRLYPAAPDESASGLTPVARRPGRKRTTSRFTDVSFPCEVRPKQTVNLRVAIAMQKRHAHDDGLDLERPESSRPFVVTVHVAAENFSIEGETRAEIVVPLERDSPAVHFRLTGVSVGPGRIMVDLSQDGRPVGSVDLWPQVVAEGQHIRATQALGLGAPPLRPTGEPMPDVVLTVYEHQYRPGRLHFTLFSRNPRLKDVPQITGGDLGTVDLRERVVTWVERQLKTLNSPGTTPQDDARTLSNLGIRLYEQVLPEALRQLCWTLAERGIGSLLILSDDPHIPWELIRPFETNVAPGQPGLLPFWGEQFAITRWLRGPATTDRFVLQQVHAMAAGGGKKSAPAAATGGRDSRNPAANASTGTARDGLLYDPSLESADDELAIMRSLKDAGASVRELPARRQELITALESGEFDFLHVASHGVFGGRRSADASALLMEDGPLTVSDLSPVAAAVLRRAAPLIFFNACSSGRSGYSLTRLGAWGAELVRMGCGAFVGTLWAVTDEGALRFAQEFYRLLIQDRLPIGEALQQARLLVRQALGEDTTWLAYCGFADPTARVERADERDHSSGLVPAVRP